MAVNSFIQHLSEGVYDPGIFKAFFLAGGPGSGKTFVTQSAFAGTGLKVVNSDTTLERNLKKANLSLNMPDEEEYFRNIIRNRAKQTAISQLDKYVQGRLGLVIDSTGRDYDVIARNHNMLQQLTLPPQVSKSSVGCVAKSTQNDELCETWSILCAPIFNL